MHLLWGFCWCLHIASLSRPSSNCIYLLKLTLQLSLIVTNFTKYTVGLSCMSPCLFKLSHQNLSFFDFATGFHSQEQLKFTGICCKSSILQDFFKNYTFLKLPLQAIYVYYTYYADYMEVLQVWIKIQFHHKQTDCWKKMEGTYNHLMDLIIISLLAANTEHAQGMFQWNIYIQWRYAPPRLKHYLPIKSQVWSLDIHSFKKPRRFGRILHFVILVGWIYGQTCPERPPLVETKCGL